MEDVKKWMESRLGSVPGLLAIIVTDRLHELHSQSFYSILILVSQGGSTCSKSFDGRVP